MATESGHSLDSSHENKGEKAGWGKQIRYVLYSTVFGLVIAWIVPYVLGEEFGTRIAARAFSAMVGDDRGIEGRDKISVLLVDDKTLAGAELSWPVPYVYYARLLDGLIIHRPKAVFFDVILTSRRNDTSIARLVDSACKAREAGTRVYFAARRGDTGSFELRPELQAVVPRCIQPVAVEYEADVLDQIAWTYPVLPVKTHEGASLSSAAATIYKDLGGTLPEHGHTILSVNWGLNPAKLGIKWTLAPTAHGADEHAGGDSPKHEAGDADDSYCRQPGSIWAETLPPQLRITMGDKAVSKPICVFHNTLYPSDLSVASAEDSQRLEEHVRDRVVMVGTALLGSNDRITSPLHGNIPGVYLHAAALDNLLLYGNDFKRIVHLKFSRDALGAFALLVLGVVVMTLFRMFREHGLKSVLQKYDFSKWLSSLHWPEQFRKSKWPHILKSGSKEIGAKAFSFVAYTIFFVIMVLVGQHWLDLGLLTVAHVTMFSFAAEWLEWGEKFVKWSEDGRESEHAPTHAESKVG